MRTRSVTRIATRNASAGCLPVLLHLRHRRQLLQPPPYTVEVFGVRLGARSSGLGQAANGVGKILGPLSLALIAGTGNIVSPKATGDAVLPAFLFLAFGMLLVGLSFTLLGVETHGRAM